MTESELKKKSVQEIRDLLESEGISKSETRAVNKPDLIKLMLSLDQPVEDTEDLSGDIADEESPDAVSTFVSNEPRVPDRYSAEWHDYVLSQLFDDEFQEGKFPSANGLRRVFNKLIGPIIDYKVKQIVPPDVNNERRATVVYSITYMDELLGLTITVEDAADCYYGNTDHPYVNRPISTATTIAEGRCLRKALGLRTMVEMESANISDEEVAIQQRLNDPPINENQKNLILRLCKKMGISADKLVKSKFEEIDSFSTATLTSREAKILLQALSEYQRGPDNKGSIIPENLLV